MEWSDFAGLQLPVSSVHGPSCGKGSRAGCFTRDEAGAALAAVHLLVRTFPFAGSDVFTPTIREQVVGDARDQLERQTASGYASHLRDGGVEDGDPLPLGDTGAVAGYRLPDTPTSDAAGPTADGRDRHGGRGSPHGRGAVPHGG